jgi:hypothetical protein
MSARNSMRVLAAIVALSASTWMPADASAPGHGNRTVAPVRIVSSHPVKSLRWGGRGWGYGRGWCYWHPYACYYR